MIFLCWNRVMNISISVTAFCRYVRHKEVQDKINPGQDKTLATSSGKGKELDKV